MNDLWYLVGLVATDGCLARAKPVVTITAKDEEYLALIKRRLGITNCVGRKFNGHGQLAHGIQICSRPLFAFMAGLGLTPAKSHTIGPLDIPTAYFPDFIRGVIDGDGSIRSWIHPQNGGEQWSLRVYSASRRFMDWLKHRIADSFGAVGKIHPRGNGNFVLKYGKLSAQKVLAACYRDGCLCLERKHLLAKACVASPRGWSTHRSIFGQVVEWQTLRTQPWVSSAAALR